MIRGPAAWFRAMPYPSISSQQDPAPQTNADGSIDIYFATELPKGVAKQNWVKTIPDQGFFVYMRYYGPLRRSMTTAGFPMMWSW